MTNRETHRTLRRRPATGDEIAGFFAEDATLDAWTAGCRSSGTWQGRDAILERLLRPDRRSLYQPGSVRLEVTSLTAGSDRVALEWTSRARTRDGEPYENHCIGVFTLADGRIVAVREYMDTDYATGLRA